MNHRASELADRILVDIKELRMSILKLVEESNLACNVNSLSNEKKNYILGEIKKFIGDSEELDRR